MGALEAPIIHLFQSFPLFQIYDKGLLDKRFEFFSNDDDLATLRLTALQSSKDRIVGFIRNLGELRVVSGRIWYSANIQAERLSRKVGFNLRPVSPFAAHVKRGIRVSEPFLSCFQNQLAKIAVFIFPFGGVTVKLSVKSDREVEVCDLVRFLRSKNINIRYKGKKFESLQDLLAFLKLNILKSLLTKEALNGVQVDLGFPRFVLFAQGVEKGGGLKPEELASILLLDPNTNMLHKKWVEEVTRNRMGMMLGDKILISKKGMYVETPVLNQSGRRSGRKLFRSIISASVAIAQAQEAALNAISTNISGLLSSPQRNLDSILVSLATCLNPELVGSRVPSQTMLPLATWRKLYNLNAKELGLSELHYKISKHTENLISAVPLTFFGNFFKWLEETPTPHFESFIERIRSKASPTPIGLEQMNLPENTKRVLHELITHYRYSTFRDEGRGVVPTSGFIRIKELAKKTNLSIAEFYGENGVIARLRSLNLVQVGEEPSTGRAGKAIVVRINPENPMIRDYLRLLGTRQPRVKLTSPRWDAQ